MAAEAEPEADPVLDTGSASPPVQPTRPLAEVPRSEPPAPADPRLQEEEDAADGAPALADPRAADTEPPRNRVIAATVALPVRPEAARAVRATSAMPARLRPLDVVLIVCTLGVYGIVLWLRQRARPA
jgi:hypothetical protein